LRGGTEEKLAIKCLDILEKDEGKMLGSFIPQMDQFGC